MSLETDKRLESSLKTATGIFHQAVAVSQAALNDGLYYLFDKYEDLSAMKVSTKKFGSIDASMSSAEISLPVKSSNYRTVIFYCIFESGKLSLTDDDGNLKSPIEMKDWRFAFEVDFSTMDVPPSSTEHGNVKQKMNQPGDYTIKRLFLDFKTHKIRNFKSDLSDFKGHKWDNIDLQSFLSLMTFWGDPDKGVMKDHEKSTLGYYLTTLQPETVNPPAPTFPPTLMKHQHYKYIAPGKTSPEEGLDLGKSNMLLYLEMTRHISFPREDILEYSGNFVTPDIKASTCVCRENFWDSYLLGNPELTGPYKTLPPLLREFNRHAYAWLGGFHIWAKLYDAGIAWSFGFGHTGYEPPREPKDFAWKRVSATKWEWSMNDSKSGKDEGTIPTKAEGNAMSATHNELWFVPGENKIHLKGDSKLWARWEKTGWKTIEEKGGVQITWNLDISMDSVSEGGLKLNMNLPANPKDIFKITELHSPWATVAGSATNGHIKAQKDASANGKDKTISAFAEGDKTSITVGSIKEAADDAVGKIDFKSMTTNLQSALLSSARFVISGGKDLTHKNPMFTNNGDLIIEARYKP